MEGHSVGEAVKHAVDVEDGMAVLRGRGPTLSPPLSDTVAEALRPILVRYVCADLAATSLVEAAVGQWECIQRAQCTTAQRLGVTVPASENARHREWAQLSMEVLHTMMHKFARGARLPAARARASEAGMAHFYRRGGVEPSLRDGYVADCPFGDTQFANTALQMVIEDGVARLKETWASTRDVEEKQAQTIWDASANSTVVVVSNRRRVRLALGCNDGTASIVDPMTGEREVHVTGLHETRVYGVALSRDGSTLAIGSNDYTVSVVDAITGQRKIHLQDLHTDGIWSVAFNSDGSLLAVGSHDKTVSVVDVVTGARKLHLTGLHTSSIRSVAFSPDGLLLAMGSGDQTASVVDVASGARKLHLTGLHTRSIRSVAFSPDGSLLAIGSDDNTASVVDVASGTRKLHLTDLHTTMPIMSVAFSPDGLLLAMGSYDKTASVVDVASGTRKLHLKDLHTDGIWSVAFP
eukprot:COSAG01_NODE_1738_length_9362_cov_3.455468_3_plen_465_part_00